MWVLKGIKEEISLLVMVLCGKLVFGFDELSDLIGLNLDFVLIPRKQNICAAVTMLHGFGKPLHFVMAGSRMWGLCLSFFGSPQVKQDKRSAWLSGEVF